MWFLLAVLLCSPALLNAAETKIDASTVKPSKGHTSIDFVVEAWPKGKEALVEITQNGVVLCSATIGAVYINLAGKEVATRELHCPHLDDTKDAKVELTAFGSLGVIDATTVTK